MCASMLKCKNALRKSGCARETRNGKLREGRLCYAAAAAFEPSCHLPQKQRHSLSVLGAGLPKLSLLHPIIPFTSLQRLMWVRVMWPVSGGAGTRLQSGGGGGQGIVEHQNEGKTAFPA